MSAPAVAGTLYRCVGRADQTINYSSTRVPEMACKAISYVGGSTHARSPVAYGHGPGNGQADASATTAPAPAETGLAGSIAIPTAAGAPVIAKIATAPPRGGIGGFGNAPQVVFRTSEGSESPAAPVIPKGVRARVTRGAMYKYTRDGISTYTNIPPPGSTGAKILFTYVETCFACGALPGVNFGTMVLNTQAYASEIAAAAHAYGVDAALVRAIIHAESDYNPNAVSYKGAQGLMQLMPGTASRFGVHNAFAAADNINGGVQYLSFLSRHFNGNVKLIAAAYNAGEGAVDRYGGVPPYTETQRYVERVGTLAERYRSAK
ncbi:MAG: lytic transglycosylase domain-containing protein [Lysobacteraceae bacterium]